VNEKASSENVCQFTVEIVNNCMKEAKKSPMNPPIMLISIDSAKKAKRIFLR